MRFQNHGKIAWVKKIIDDSQASWKITPKQFVFFFHDFTWKFYFNVSFTKYYGLPSAIPKRNGKEFKPKQPYLDC